MWMQAGETAKGATQSVMDAVKSPFAGTEQSNWAQLPTHAKTFLWKHIVIIFSFLWIRNIWYGNNADIVFIGLRYLELALFWFKV